MSIPIRQSLDFEDAARILNLPAPSADTEPATKGYVDALVDGLAWKDNCRVASTADINLAAPGSSIDSISLTSGDRVLVKDQTDTEENGVYIWNGAATPMTRSSDADTAGSLESAVVTIDQGTTNEGTTWRQESVNFILDTDPVVWSSFGVAAPSASEGAAGIAELATQSETNTGTDDARIVTPLKLKNYTGRGRGATASIGDGAATVFNASHNWGTYALIAEVWEVTGSRRKVEVQIEQPDNNTVRVTFVAAPASSSHELRIREVPTF